MTGRMMLGAATGFSLVCSAGGAAATSDGRPFTFRAAEFMQPDRGLAAARTFVAVDLPPGLPIAVALQRVQRAAMFCPPPTGLATICEYSLPIHVEGGIIGEDRWRVILIGDGYGRLQATTLNHYSIGTPNPQ